MLTLRKFIWALVLASGAVWATSASPGLAQVSPAEIRDPELKAIEETYLKALLEISRGIARIRFPFPFALTRYVGLDAKQEAGTDTRGLEFVKFHNRVILKVSGNYSAAYNADLLTENQRANQVLDDVIVPILRLVSDSFPSDARFDAYGFEISWHARRRASNYDYEGKEIIALVQTRVDALSYIGAPRDSVRQEILDRSELYVNGKQFGLELGQRDPLPADGLKHATAQPPAADSGAQSPPSAADSDNRLASVYKDPLAGLRKPEAKAPTVGQPGSPDSGRVPLSDKPQPAPAKLSPAGAEALQNNHRAELDALAKEGISKFHFVDYAPPSFVIFRNRIYLQLTMRNPDAFDKNATSIYKRAAQTFDLFLAPQLKSLLDSVPAVAEFEGLDITVLNQLTSLSKPSSEAVEFVCPFQPLRQFAEAGITNQDLINQSWVLVNGVRIALNPQQVE